MRKIYLIISLTLFGAFVFFLVFFSKSITLIRPPIVFDNRGNVCLSINYPFRERGQLVRVNLNGEIIDKITNDRKSYAICDVSKNGEKILFKENMSKGLYIVNANGKGKKIQIKKKGAISDAKFLGDSQKIIYSEVCNEGSRGAKNRLVVYDIKFGQVKVVTENSHFLYFCIENHSQNIIFFLAQDTVTRKNRLYRMSLLSLEEERLLQEVSQIKLSGDKKIFLYQTQLKTSDPYLDQIYMKSPNGQDDKLLFTANPGSYIESFDISPKNECALILLCSGEDRMNYTSLLVLLNLQTLEQYPIKLKIKGVLLDDKKRISSPRWVHKVLWNMQ